MTAYAACYGARQQERAVDLYRKHVLVCDGRRVETET